MITRIAASWPARAIVIWFAAVALCGCATPPEIKALSTAQLTYIDTAIEAVKQQGDALVSACDLIRQKAVAKIQEEEDSARDTATKGVMAAPASTATILQAAIKTLQAANDSRAKLQAAIDNVRARTQELQAFLVELKNAQTSLNTYLQSEQAGERITRDILGLAPVQQIVANASTLMNVVKAKSGQLQDAVNGLKTLAGGM